MAKLIAIQVPESSINTMGYEWNTWHRMIGVSMQVPPIRKVYSEQMRTVKPRYSSVNAKMAGQIAEKP